MAVVVMAAAVVVDTAASAMVEPTANVPEDAVVAGPAVGVVERLVKRRVLEAAELAVSVEVH